MLIYKNFSHDEIAAYFWKMEVSGLNWLKQNQGEDGLGLGLGSRVPFDLYKGWFSPF